MLDQRYWFCPDSATSPHPPTGPRQSIALYGDSTAVPPPGTEYLKLVWAHLRTCRKGFGAHSVHPASCDRLFIVCRNLPKNCYTTPASKFQYVEMDHEKGFQADISFQNQPYWASCYTCRATQKKQFIIKSIFGSVLLGLLALIAYQSLHALPTTLSSLQLEQHHAISIEAPPNTGSAPYNFVVYAEDGCSGKSNNIKGDGPSVSCQPFNQPYNSTSISTLNESLKLCFYPDQECGGQPDEFTSPTECQTVQETNSYRVLTSDSECPVDDDEEA